VMIMVSSARFRVGGAVVETVERRLRTRWEIEVGFDEPVV